MTDPTPFDLLAAENASLRAQLQLADERAFFLQAEIARLNLCVIKDLKHFISLSTHAHQRVFLRP